MEKKLNLCYAGIHGTYWMLFGACFSFSSIFLLGRGYTNSQIGLILAIGNVLAVALQPFLGDLADRSKRWNIFNIMEGIAVVLIISVGALFLIKKSSPGLSFFFVMAVGWTMILQPFCNALSGKLEECGIGINFGACRSIGSLAYSILTGILGTVIEKRGIEVIPVTAEIVLVLFVLATLLVSKTFAAGLREAGAREASQPAAPPEEIDLKLFTRRHKMFLVLCFGVLGVFFGNSTVNTYMAQIAAAVGGDSGDVGRIFSLLAFLEIPTMVLFNRLLKRFRLTSMLKFAAVAFVLWTGGAAISWNVNSLLAAQFFQPFGFALFLPAMVRFVNVTMDKGEAVKGQTLYTTATTSAMIVASLVGGAILDVSGAKALTAIATVITAIGAAIVIFVVEKAEKEGAR